ncbi:DUF2795 domain-containing protein [Nocardia transvalensis]|uniref:DUF2795 domain-containing protein n=1 Tax=Nocardia transvalensis TaxID=37333 RepID=UPI001894F3D0|nr:DUF2795 domain-containing protein [Nocardia transvalensis]MBF6327770.1 DUF2795 domain-containing protein [Nocardia transvalensis]
MVNPIQVQKFLHGVDYPCDRDSLIDAARSNGADDDVISELQQIPDRTYNGPNAVSEAVAR